MMEHKERGRNLGYETFTADNVVPCPGGVIVLSVRV